MNQQPTRRLKHLQIMLAGAVLLALGACGGSGGGASGGSSSSSSSGGDAPPLAIVSTSPAALALVDAGSVSQVTVTFDKNVDDATVTAANIYLSGPSGDVAATRASSGTTATLTPSAALADGAAYTLTVTTGLHATDGGMLSSNAAVSFTTRAISLVASDCATNVYAGGLTLVSGMDNAPLVSSATPAKGVVFAEANYHTCLVRVTDRTIEGGSPGFLRNDYSRRQAFNADGSRLLTYAYNGAWHLYDASTLEHVAVLNGPAADAEPQWHPTDPNLLYFVPTNGGMVLYQLDVATGTRTTVGDFTGRLPWASAEHVWTKSEGSPSADARYWCFMADDAGFQSVGIFVWDRQTDTILGTLPTNGNRPDHVSMSPSGRHCVVSWGPPDGTVSLSRTLVREYTLNAKSEHSDIARGANGDDVYVSIDYSSSPPLEGDVFMVDLDTGVRTELFPTYLNRTATAMHFSGKAFNKPGWAVISSYAGYNADGDPFIPQWLHEKVFAVQLAANPTIYMLAHHHRVNSSGWNVQDPNYWTEPQASVNRDLTRVVFNSNWEVASAAPEDYMIVLPANAIP